MSLPLFTLLHHSRKSNRCPTGRRGSRGFPYCSVGKGYGFRPAGDLARQLVCVLLRRGELHDPERIAGFIGVRKIMIGFVDFGVDIVIFKADRRTVVVQFGAIELVRLDDQIGILLHRIVFRPVHQGERLLQRKYRHVSGGVRDGVICKLLLLEGVRQCDIHSVRGKRLFLGRSGEQAAADEEARNAARDQRGDQNDQTDSAALPAIALRRCGVVVVEAERISARGVEAVSTGEEHVLLSLGELVELVAEVLAQLVRDHIYLPRLFVDLEGLLFSVFQVAELPAGNAVDVQLARGVFDVNLHFVETGDKFLCSFNCQISHKSSLLNRRPLSPPAP